jgi:methylated-DNA-[protein]-cysteine S-methyltransferase
MHATGHTVIATPIGAVGLAWSERGVTRVVLPCVNEDATRETTARLSGAPPSAEPPSWVLEVVTRLRGHLEGALDDLRSVPLDIDAAPAFHRKVYEAMRAMGPGNTCSYGELAAHVGAPSAARAVGQAMAKNPVPLIVPCHRVLAASGRPGGFSAHDGVRLKARLLALEGVRPPRAYPAVPTTPRDAEKSAYSSVTGLATHVATSFSKSNPTLPLFDGGQSLPFDAEEAERHLRAVDPKLERLMRRVGPLALTRKAETTTFAALAEAIVYQQLAGKAAAAIFARVRALFPREEPTAEALATLSDEDLRGAGLSRTKMAALRDLAERTLRGEVPDRMALEALDDEAIVERLTRIRGVGRWTVEMLLIFRLGRPDVLPVDDYGVRKGFAVAFGTKELPTAAALEKRGARWAPFRTAASWYLWRAADA